MLMSPSKVDLSKLGVLSKLLFCSWEALTLDSAVILSDWSVSLWSGDVIFLAFLHGSVGLEE
uniref:Uncharacterized protein n=1 Tax=Arundo donax TaxID=35708 RepID=A0A0A9GY05_ARUDO